MAKILQYFSIFIILFLSSGSQAQNWKKQAKSVNAGLLNVNFISKSTGFVLSLNKVLKTSDSGKTWTQILSGYNGFLAIKFSDSQNGYLIGHNDLVLKSSDGGSNWTLKRTGNADDDLFLIELKGPDTIFVMSHNDLDKNDTSKYLMYSYNGGNNWTRLSLKTSKIISSMAMHNKNSGIATLFNGQIFETNNGFTTYTESANIGLQITDSKIIKDSVIMLVGKGGKLARSSNSGKAYKNISSPINDNLNSLYFVNDTFGIACGDNGAIIITRNRGLSWAKMTTNTKLNFSGIFIINPFLAWAVAYSTNGDSVDIFKWEDKSCISKYVKIPRDTVICDKYDFETIFKTSGKYNPTWTVNDALTNLKRNNDSIAKIYTLHEGKFLIFYELKSCDEILLDTTTVFFWRNPSISVKDSVYCGSVNDDIYFSCFACQFLWSSGFDGFNFGVNQPGKYWVRATNYCKSISDTFTLSYLPYLKLNLGNDTNICNQQTLLIKNTLAQGKYLWNDNDTSRNKIITKAGKYYLNFENRCNSLSDTISVKFRKTPRLNLGPDSIYCTSIHHEVDLDSIKDNASVIWDNMSQLYNRNMTLSGKYYATIFNECGKSSDTIRLNVLNIPTVDLGMDTLYCNNFKHQIEIKTASAEDKIVWNDGKDSLRRNFYLSGQYSVKISNRCGVATDSINLNQISKPLVNLGKDTSLLKPFTLQLDAKNEGSEYKWSIGPTSPTITVNDFGKYWVTVKNYCGEHSDTITIYNKAGINQNFKNNFIKVYPNPIKDDILFIEYLNGLVKAEISLEIYDQFGSRVLEKNAQNNQQKIDFKGLCKGIYYIQLSKNGLMMDVIRVLKL